MKNKATKIFLIIIFTILLLPTWFMLVGSFQNLNGIMAMPPSLYPKTIFLNNYLSLLQYPVVTWAINTFYSLFILVLLSTFISTITAYFFLVSTFKYKEVLFNILLISILMPRISFLIPTYIIIKKLHISGTLLAVILSSAYTSGGILLARNYFEKIPKSIFEAARIDGASDSDIFFNIVLPIMPPAIITLALSTSIFYLTDFMWQMLVLQKEDNQTLLIGLIKTTMQTQFSGAYGINPLGRMMAVGIVLFFPLLVIFLIANKYYISSRGGEVKE